MANIKSAAKRARTSRKKKTSNVDVRSRLRGLIRQYQAAVDKKDLTKAQTLLLQTQSAVDTAVGRGVIHKNVGARHKSRLARALVPLTKAKPKRATRARKKAAPTPEPPVETKLQEEKVAAP
ncbi:MAG: 30S ribosomal protein S20 [Bacillota bacterium]